MDIVLTSPDTHRKAGRTVSELASLKDRTALVVGGAGHIGSAMCEALVEAGARVAIMDLELKRCCEVVDRLAEIPDAVATAHSFDLTQPKNLARTCAEIAKLHGSLDILVHAAAWVGTTETPGWNAPFESQTLDAWKQGFEVNLTSAFSLVQAAAPLLKASGHGSVVLVGSIYGSSGPDWSLYEGLDMSCPAAYAASKGGLCQFMKYLATTLAPAVRVNMISPGGIQREQPGPFVERYNKRTPLGRMGREEDLKGATLFLASDLSCYVTGHELRVDGGWTAW